MINRSRRRVFYGCIVSWLAYYLKAEMQQLDLSYYFQLELCDITTLTSLIRLTLYVAV